MPLASSCWPLNENSQLYGRKPQPNREPSSPATAAAAAEFCHMSAFAAAQVSTWFRLPASPGPCAAGLVRSQSGTKFALLSTQFLVAVRTTLNGVRATSGLLATSD